MSGLGLFERDINERTATLNITDQVEPGVFDNFFYGAGMAAARTAAKAASGLDLAASVGPILKDYITGGTEAQDRWFKEHDAIFKNAVNYWTPKPNETGIAGEITGQLLATLPMVIASPALATAQMQMSTAEDLVNKGVSPQRANVVGGVVGAGFGLGVWMPILGQNLWQRVAIGGAGFNAAQGIVTRGAAGALLEGTPAAKDFEAFSPVEITLDVLLGAAFGGLVHLSPQGRAQGAKAWQDIKAWAEKLTPTQKDALATLRQAQHLNMDSMPPGKPVTPESINEHVLRMRQAIDQMARDKPVNVDQPPATPVEAVEPGIPDTSPTERAPSPLDKYSTTPDPVREVADQTLTIAQQEIEADIAAGIIPAEVKSFEELHDYVDANMYVNDADRPEQRIGALGKAQGWQGEQFAEFTNKMIDATTAWLGAGRVGRIADYYGKTERAPEVPDENVQRAADLVQAAEEVRAEHDIPELPQELGGRLQDLSALPVDQQPQAIANAVADALRGVGVPDEEARGSGAIWGAFFKVMGERPGQTPASLLERYGVNIRRMGEGQALADALDQAGYHGTHALFDRFSLQKIGSGEGAQAYGWGLYFSSSKEVAQWYKENVTRRRAKQGLVLVDEQALERHIENDVQPEDEPVIRAFVSQMRTGLDIEKARTKALLDSGHDVKKVTPTIRRLDAEMVDVAHRFVHEIGQTDEAAYRLPDGKVVHQRFNGPDAGRAAAARELINGTYAQARYAKNFDADRAGNLLARRQADNLRIQQEIEAALNKGKWPADIGGVPTSKKDALDLLQKRKRDITIAQREYDEAEAYRQALEDWTSPGRPPETITVEGEPIVLYDDIQGSIARDTKTQGEAWWFRQTGASPKMFPTLEAAKAYADAGNRVVTAKLERVIPPKPTGRLYEVEIPDQAHMLDWDKPFANQPEALKKLFREIYPKAEGMDLTGKFLYRRLVEMMKEEGGEPTPPVMWASEWLMNQTERPYSPEELASRYLNAHGVPGISYEGGSSRVRNYVVFDDSNVQITRFEQRDSVRPSPAVLEALKDTKVVDENGRPLQVYHGKQGASVVDAFRNGPVWFHTDPEYASNWSGAPGFDAKAVGEGADRQGAPHVYPVYLDIRNPYDPDVTPIKFPSKTGISDLIEAEMAPYDPAVIKYLEELGYDGIRQEEARGNDMEPRGYIWVAFRPEQIKSVFNDRPTSDPRILYQDDRGDRTFYSELERKIKAAPMKSAPAQGWRDYIKSQIGKGVKQDEIEATGIYDWLDLEGAPKPVPEPGFRVVEEMKNDQGEWEQVDDLGIVGKTEEQARAQITEDLKQAPALHSLAYGGAEVRLSVVPHDRLNLGKVEHPKITREQVQQFMADNGVRVVTKQAGGTAATRSLSDPAIAADMQVLKDNGWTVENDPDNDRYIAYMDNEGNLEDAADIPGYVAAGDIDPAVGTAIANIQRYWDAIPNTVDRPRYAKPDYLLPGGEKQVELLLTLPPKQDRLPTGYQLSQMADGRWTLAGPDQTGRILTGLPPTATRAEAVREALTSLERQWKIADRGLPNTFTQNHFPDTENLLAHTRGNERTVPVDDLKDSHPELHARLKAEGRTEAKLFFVEEVQSDWSQRGGEYGFRDEERIRRLTAEHDALMGRLGPLGEQATQVVKKYVHREMPADSVLGNMLMAYRQNPDPVVFNMEFGIPAGADRDLLTTYMQALLKEEDFERQMTAKNGTIPAAPFVAKRTFGIFKDGAELEREDKNGKKFSERYDTREAAEAAAKKAGGEVRDMGLTEDTQAWASLVAKRILRYAAEQGADLIAWTSGKQQVDRWSSALRRQVDAIEWTKTPEGIHLVGYKDNVTGSEVTHILEAIPETVRRHAQDAVIRNDRLGFDTSSQAVMAVIEHADWQTRWEIEHPQDIQYLERFRQEYQAVKQRLQRRNKVVDTTEKENALSDAIGKTMAEQIISDPNQSGSIEGADITVSSTGMAGFYDRVWPAVLNKVSKQIGGGKVNTLEMPLPGFNPTKIPPHPTTAEPTWREMTSMERETYSGVEDFPGDGKPPLAEDTTILIGDQEIDVTLMLSPQGLHIVGMDAADNPFEWVYDNFRPSVLAYRDDLARAVKLIWDDPELTLWGNLRAVLGELPHEAEPKPNRSPQMSLEITPAMREKIMAGLPLFQRAPTEPNMAGSLRGQIQFGNGETVIGLFKGANPTTFMHETGHLFLEITKDLAGRADAPEQALQDWATLSQWLKIEGGPVTREAHEQFARTWEQYLGTGEAPTPELRSVFQAFRDWILEVYQDLKNIIGAKLNPEIRGVLDRMLASQRADPADRAEGPQVPAKESGLPPPPPPETEAGPADPEALMRPEGDEQAVLDAQRSIQEAEAAQTPPAAEQGLVEPLPMEDPELRSELQAMANEAGWAQIGGRNLGNVMGVPNFSTWIPKAEWWPGRPDKMNEAKTREAVRKALAGEPLKAAEKRLIDYMKDYASKQIRSMREIPEERRAEIANALIAEELEATPKNTIDLDEVARANELDEAAVERAAIRYADDDTAFMAEIRAINEQGRKAAESRKTAQTGQEGEAGTGQGADTGTGKDAALDPLAEAAQRFVDENPDRMITVGQEPDGTPIRMTSREYLEQSRADVAQAIEDSKLFDAAAGCLLGNS